MRTIRTRHPRNFATLLMLDSGVLSWKDTEREIEGPALCFWPAHDRPRLQTGAGAQMKILGLSESLLADALGAKAESVHLRMLVEHPFDVGLSDANRVLKVNALLDWFQTELTDPEARSPMSLAAYLRIVLIQALRVHRPDPADGALEKTSILRRFRHLVELHYRDHWLVPQYAEELGVDYDRLHRICKRETRRSPAELVHERLTAEAKARLEKTGHPLKKIASDLGFADATRFSHFFKRRTEMSPGAYRAVVSRPEGDNLAELKQGFSDWP
ncbi:AraC family transcriptional regulator [Ruegeria atlantica]|uniref:AraC family transcriptional regulator n=1 Tax=Ruegeria atlantica TaxID=81569 RepID=UPI0024940572|nr:AraC family transcriptional regulator [Ruegeria atlantica]